MNIIHLYLFYDIFFALFFLKNNLFSDLKLSLEDTTEKYVKVANNFEVPHTLSVYYIKLYGVHVFLLTRFFHNAFFDNFQF